MKLKKLYSPPGKRKAVNKLPALLLKKSRCKGNLSHTRKMFIERPAYKFYLYQNMYIYISILFALN